MNFKGQVMEDFAGHCQEYTSDKVWAACYTDAGEFIVVYGRRPMPNQGGCTQMGSVGAARSKFHKMVKEKLGKGYQEVPWDDRHYGLRSFVSSTPSTAPTPATVATSRAAATTSLQALMTRQAEKQRAAFEAIRVVVADSSDLERWARDPNRGISEKVNGMRCILESDGGTLTAYNRRAMPMPSLPSCAAALGKLGVDFRLDGEWIPSPDGDVFAVFDVLTLEGDMRQLPYLERIEQLRQRLRTSNLVATGAPTLSGALAGSVTPGLALLLSESKEAAFAEVVNQVMAEGGEGVIVRQLTAAYSVGGEREVSKFKFTQDVDAIAIGVEPGVGGGSVTLGLLRPSDGALIEVGHVRSGLSAQDMAEIGAMVARGERPVLTVTYLGARTVGTRLVEARTSMDRLRSDKTAVECTTDQLGAAKAAMFAAARPSVLAPAQGALRRAI